VVDDARTVRTIETDEEIIAYLRGMMTSFLAKRELPDGMVAFCRGYWELERTWIAVDGETQCGTARTFPSRLRLPGLSDVPVSCLTQVTVLPTHTRRGHLTRLMEAQLRAAIDAGEVASLLIAAEWPIYGRFGYGPAGEWASWEVDVAHAEVQGQPVGTCELVDMTAWDAAAEIVLAGQQTVTPGCIERPDWLRKRVSGLAPSPADEPDKTRVWLLHRAPSGQPDGVVIYDAKEKWDGMRPANTLKVADMAFVDPVAERELWRYLLDVDLVGPVTWDGSPASSVRHVLRNGRAARQVGRWDYLWARILDVPAALTTRSYAVADELVVEVADPSLDRGGRFRFETGSDGATCDPTAAAPDLTLPVSALSGAWLGGTDLRSLSADGSIDEHTAGATDRLAAVLGWHQTPWSHTDF
jgi:predicted acetyltransferase